MTISVAWAGACGKVRLYPPIVIVFVLSAWGGDGLSECGRQIQQPRQFTFYFIHVNFLETIPHV